MRVVCIEDRILNQGDDGCQYPNFKLKEKLTINKAYDVILSLPQTYKIVNDNGEVVEYLKLRFIPLDEYRNSILDKIL